MSFHVMVDLETLSTSPDAAILSIGAVKFDPFNTKEPVDAFYQAIEATSCQAYNLKIDAATVIWWMSEAQEPARTRYMGERHMDLPSALEGFTQWYGRESVPVWGNGSDFDNVILRTALERCGFEVPWKFYHNRCYRTFKQSAPRIKPPKNPNPHHALYDAATQAKHLQAIIKKHGIKNL